jgi:hypothetical protein
VTIHLLDVNVLIALIDPAHVHHEQAHDWFARVGKRGFATCPITENALLRIVSHPKYPNTPGSPGVVAGLLEALRALPGHCFWPDALSISDTAHVDPARLSGHAQVTDTYLLALARSQGGRLATMDRHLVVDAVRDGAAALALI